MAALFDGSTQFLTNSSPTIAIPFAMAAWVKYEGSGYAFSVTNSASDTDFIVYDPNAGLISTDGITSNIVSNTVVSSTWVFACARVISSSNYRLDILNADGSTFHGQNTTTCNPAGLNCVTISGYNTQLFGLDASLNGSVAEFWYTNADIQADGAALDDALLRQLAYGGPFSVPHIAASVVDYRSLRQAIGSDQDSVDAFSSRYGRQTWENMSGTPAAPHPPLPYWYVRPGQTKTQLVI